MTTESNLTTPRLQPMSQTDVKVSLTGIKPTGEPHLGNYIGAIRPALELTKQHESIYFIADYHALTSIRDAELLRHYTRSVAATWLAAGLDPTETLIYRQSDVPEIFEMHWVMSCITAKGLMNRAHAYKAARDQNAAAGRDELDAGINMGLYNYPVLMAVDILIMGSDIVPVGKDQMQHVEYAADIAGTFNHLYGKAYTLKIPEASVPAEDSGRTLPGLDGRKMSKSYGNTIPLFLPEAKLRKMVRKIPTDSTPVEEPKDPETSHVFQILAQFATPAETEETRQRLTGGGYGWGQLKNDLADILERELGPMRERYDTLMEPGSELDRILHNGAEEARKRARPVLDGVRAAIGI